MSTFDNYQLVRRQEQQPETIVIYVKGNESSGGSNGYGNVLGVAVIVIGVLALPVTGGASVLAVLAGAFLFGGERVTDATCKAMNQQATQHDPQGVNQAAAKGCGGLVLYIAVAIVIFALVALALGGAGLMPGCKVCGG